MQEDYTINKNKPAATEAADKTKDNNWETNNKLTLTTTEGSRQEVHQLRR
jgi:hypothetical protein